MQSRYQAASSEQIPALRLRSLWHGLGIGFVALVIYLSLAPRAAVPMPPAANWGHVVAYFWLMLWYAQIYRTRTPRLLLAAAFSALGVALEYAQAMTGYRHFDYFDMLRNCAGVALGLLAARTSLQDALHRFERTFAP